MIHPAELEACKVSKFFGAADNRVVALNNVSLRLKKGQFALLMGPSGSGKSSLLAALGGLQAPSAGIVRFQGREVWSENDSEVTKYRRQHCGFVFQSGGLFPALSAVKQIAFPLIYLGIPKSEAYRRAKTALTELGLHDRPNSRPSEMSGGQNQRVAIARMLAKQPSLIFCDEPTSALDSENGETVARMLKLAAHTHNAVVLCVTHDDRLRPFADRVLEIKDGEITKDSEVSE